MPLAEFFPVLRHKGPQLLGTPSKLNLAVSVGVCAFNLVKAQLSSINFKIGITPFVSYLKMESISKVKADLENKNYLLIQQSTQLKYFANE